MHTPSDDLLIAHTLADRAGAAILPHFRALAGVEDKGGGAFDPVTAADRAAEAAMREHLATVRPRDAVLGEEFAREEGDSGRTWVLDPIDGTRGFLMGLPSWGTLIALCEAPGAGPIVGVMDQSFVGERFYAGGGEAQHRRGDRVKPVRTRGCANLGAALAASTSPFLFGPASAPRFQRLTDSVRQMRYGTDCYAYALLAAGHIDIVMEEGLRPFDIAPFIPLIEAAGGIITDFSGNPIGPTLLAGFAGEALALGDPSLLGAVLNVLGR